MSGLFTPWVNNMLFYSRGHRTEKKQKNSSKEREIIVLKNKNAFTPF